MFATGKQIRTLPANVKLFLINEACYAVSWTTLAFELSGHRDVLIETEPSNYSTISPVKYFRYY